MSLSDVADAVVSKTDTRTADAGASAISGLSTGPPAAIAHSFTATRNAVTATRLQGSPRPLRRLMESHEAFAKAFEDKDKEGDGDAGATGRGPRPPRRPPSVAGKLPATILRSSRAQSNMARPARWGLVSAIVEAYNRHHELVLRPDDIWQAIITQFSFYVNAHPEELRDRFVDFQGKKTLVIQMGGSLYSADYASFAHRMVHENIVTNIKDPSVVEWLLPQFSTTTWTDRVAASVSLMSTLQAYFQYVCCLLCGIPKVTLLGTPEDWRCLRTKIDRLLEYNLKDGHMAAWHLLLVPVLDQLVKSAEGHPDLDFWDQVCSHEGGGSGPSYLSGWVTVFAVFSSTGQWQGVPPRQRWREADKSDESDASAESPWPWVDFDELPGAVVSVPVLIDDNGTQYDAQMLAGQFAYEDYGREGVALQPRTDWCIACKEQPRKKPRVYRHGEVRREP